MRFVYVQLFFVYIMLVYKDIIIIFVILDKRGKNCTRFGLGAPLSGGRPCCGGRFEGRAGTPLKWGVFGDYVGIQIQF